MKFNNRLFPSYDIVVLSKYWQHFQGYFFTKFCFNMVKNIFSKMTVKFEKYKPSLPINSVFEMKPFQDLHYFHECIFAFVFISNSLIF